MSENARSLRRRGSISYAERLSWMVERVEAAARIVTEQPTSLLYVKALAGRLEELDRFRATAAQPARGRPRKCETA